MNPISAYEHEIVRATLSEAQKGALERLRGPLAERMFSVGWRDVSATSFVGVIQIGSRVIQILPKMHRGGDLQQRTREATANLLFLLSYTGRLRITDPEISRLTASSAPLSEILYWIFSHQLWNAVRHELLRGYVPVESRLNVIRGRWLVGPQARRSDGWRRDRFDLLFDEFTEDNLPNRLFHATVLRLSRWATRTETRRHLAQLRSAFADVTDISPTSTDFDTAKQWIVSHRRRMSVGRLYRPLLETARIFWEGVGTHLSAGRIDAFAFMFDMNKLFEEFIAEFIRRELRSLWQERGWTIRVQSEGGNKHLVFDEYGRETFKLLPDIRFVTNDGGVALIIDTKHKLLDASAAKLGIAEGDAYQMFAYKKRYRCGRVVLLYPQSSERIARDFSADADSASWLHVRTVNLQRDFTKPSERKELAHELAAILKGDQTL